MNENLLRISFTFILLAIWLSYTQSVIVRENEKDSIINETAVSLLQEEPVYFVENTQEKPKQEEIQENKQEEIKQQEEPKQEEIQKQEEPQENKQEEVKQEEPQEKEIEEVKQEETQEKEIEENKEKEQKQEENVKSEIYISQEILGEAIQAMAVQKNYIAVAGKSGFVVLIDRKSKQKIDWIAYEKSDSITHLYFTQDEKYLFSVDHKGYIIKWNLANKRDEKWYSSNSNIDSMTFSNDGNLFSIQTAKYTRIYDFSTDKAKNISSLSRLGQSIVITSDSILSLCKETTKRMSSFCVYGMKNNKWDRKPLFETSDFIGNMISYDSDCIAWNQNQIFSLNATESLQKKAWQWNLWQTCPKNIDSIVYNEDGSMIGVIDIDSMITFYERATGKQLATFHIPNNMKKESIYIVNAFQLILLSNNGNIYKVDFSF